MDYEILEDTIRLFVSEGSGIASNLIVPGFQNATAPTKGLFASATMLSETTRGISPHTQYVGKWDSFTVDHVVVESSWQIDFFRDGALRSARMFRDFARSESGKNWAASANVDGRVRGINVYDGGTGYVDGDKVYTMYPHPNDEPDGFRPFKGTAQVDSEGRMYRILSDEYGSMHKDIPLQNAPNYLPANEPDHPLILVSSNGTGATLGAMGFGFVVKNDDMQIFRLDEELERGNGQWEERASITLVICHSYVHIDNDSGRVEAVLQDPPKSLIRIPTSPPPEDKIMYLFQTNLIPDSPTTSTLVSSPNDGVAIDRVAEWSLTGLSIPAGNGFAEVTLFDTDRIKPQHGRDLIATSPFMTNYEGNLAATFPDIDGVSNFAFVNGIYYIKTIHKIPGAPNITSVRAVRFPTFALGNQGFTIPIRLNSFNSMVMLENSIRDGGVIGIEIRLGVGLTTTQTNAQVDEIIRDLNINASSLSHTLQTGDDFNLRGFGTRVTFMQFDLG